eukprot:scaffold10510_cov84-Skeletonema_dohrnii-CCMP3373.AAC.4
MSTDRGGAADMCCASCGKAELDDIKLMDCADCDLVKYCSDECEEDHRRQHEVMCKERAAQLRDEILFRQPESSHRGDCPICFLPLPIDLGNSMMSCCSKIICRGCAYTNDLREVVEKRHPACPFCRHPTPKSQEEAVVNYMKRAEKNDPNAMNSMGNRLYDEGDYVGAFEYFTKAAELSDAMSHYKLSILYQEGLGVEKDEKKELYHLEEAAIAGHPDARYNLAVDEWENERFDRSAKHFIIAANLGHDGSIQTLKEYYKRGLVSKDDFAAALRAHHAAVEATKSPQRDAAEASENFRASQQQTFGEIHEN